MRSYTTMILALVGFVLSVGASAASAETVYDNTTTNINVSQGLDTEFGDQITLAGTGRTITELEIGFLGVAGTDDRDLTVRMYKNDAPEGKPGTPLYDSGVLSVSVCDGLNTLTVYPDVEVPDTFTWTLQWVEGGVLQMPRYGPPTIGSSSGDFFWHNSQGTFWYAYPSSHEDNFYARVEAADSDPVELLNTLVQTVIGLNLHHGIENSLDAKLDAALQALDDVNANNDVAAVNVLEAFMNAVEAQRDNKIPEADADSLIADTQQIITLLTEG